MFELFKFKNKKLCVLFDCLKENIGGISTEDRFKKILNDFSEYDQTFLWLLCYPREHVPIIRKYISKTYKKFHQFLDVGVLNKMIKKDRFDSHMWEIVLCDILSRSGELLPKTESGSDFLLKLGNGMVVQVEGICPGESDDSNLRSIRPHYSKDNPIFSLGGNIDDLEKPVLLRALKGFDDKAKSDKYDKNTPLIIAINSSKAVGLVSNDDYILRRMLFGLGNHTITRMKDGEFINGLQYNPSLNKLGQEPFWIARFLNPDYSHVSGVIYTSQKPTELVPGGYGWSNSGIFYVPNPNAKNKIDISFPFFKKMTCNREIYRVDDASEEFNSELDY